MVEGVVRELANRHDIAGLMERSNDQTRRISRARGGEAGGGDSLNARRNPTTVWHARQCPVRDALGLQGACPAWRDRISNRLQIFRDLTREHFDVARPE